MIRPFYNRNMASNIFQRGLHFFTTTPNQRARERAAREMEERLGPLDQAIGQPSRDRSPRRVSQPTRQAVRAWNRHHGREDDTDVLTSGSERERRLETETPSSKKKPGKVTKKITETGQKFGEGVSKSLDERAMSFGSKFAKGITNTVSNYASQQYRAAKRATKRWVYNNSLGYIWDNSGDWADGINLEDIKGSIGANMRGESSDPLVNRDNYMHDLVTENETFPLLVTNVPNKEDIAKMPMFHSMDSNYANLVESTKPKESRVKRAFKTPKQKKEEKRQQEQEKIKQEKI